MRITRLIGICLLGIISVACSTSLSYLSTFIQNGNTYESGKWSPDGRWFAAAIDDLSETLQLFTPDGTLVQTWHPNCFNLGSRMFAWLPDGRISCVANGETNPPPGPTKLVLFELNQKGLLQKSSEVAQPFAPGGMVYDFQWNPHHPWLASIADSQPQGHISPTLYLTNMQGQNLIDPLPVDAAGLAWSPDGTILALVRQDGDIDLLKIEENGSTQLVITQTNTLKADTDSNENVEWSPSGHWLVCRHASYNSEDYLFLLATDGSGKQIKLTSSTTDGQLDFPAWSPDGKRLIISQVVITGGALLSLDMTRFLKDQGLQP